MPCFTVVIACHYFFVQIFVILAENQMLKSCKNLQKKSAPFPNLVELPYKLKYTQVCLRKFTLEYESVVYRKGYNCKRILLKEEGGREVGGGGGGKKLRYKMKPEEPAATNE